MTYVLEGEQKKAACHIFQIGRDTLYRWMQQYQTEGGLAPKSRGKYASRKLDDAVVAQYIADHHDATLEELGEVFTVRSWRFGKPDKACGLLEKKTLLYPERDEPARAQFQDELADLDPNELVYLDESEVDEARIAPMLVRHAAQR